MPRGVLLVSTKSVLIVDEDLGFVFWLGRVLGDAGYEAWPARSTESAATLVNELHTEMDLLIINPNSTGAGEFVADRRRRSHKVKTITIKESDDVTVVMSGVDAEIIKPSQCDELSRLELLCTVKRILSKWEQ
jgi:DNA-binding response OmpR family regulator